MIESSQISESNEDYDRKNIINLNFNVQRLIHLKKAEVI